ncbi:hypothetical protein AVEN_166316-1 [Araneus ventricosus]|uniref:Uncharacterized protein n=1 Tax=Araneus ventricosus TaxID=182803 RepID=A0A4Y2U284_ARAVE|nr:hypothetical protein AVEN_166316-1 [Araneus ventricosus]
MEHRVAFHSERQKRAKSKRLEHEQVIASDVALRSISPKQDGLVARALSVYQAVWPMAAHEAKQDGLVARVPAVYQAFWPMAAHEVY